MQAPVTSLVLNKPMSILIRLHLHHWCNGNTFALQAKVDGSSPLWCFNIPHGRTCRCGGGIGRRYLRGAMKVRITLPDTKESKMRCVRNHIAACEVQILTRITQLNDFLRSPGSSLDLILGERATQTCDPANKS